MTPESPEVAQAAPPEAAAPNRRRLTAGEVREYLLAHPGFLTKNPEVLEHQALPARADADGHRVVDFQRALVDRLRNDNAKLRSFQSEVLTAARANVSAQSLVHEAILLLLEAESFEHLIHAITLDLAPMLGIDVVTLSVETLEAVPERPSLQNFYLVPPGTVDGLIDPGRPVRLISQPPEDSMVFGPATPLVQSQALARLDIGGESPLGLLALGSREATKYEPGQGSELLGFLAGTVERLIRLWLRPTD